MDNHTSMLDYRMKLLKASINRNRKELINKDDVNYKSLTGDSLINKLCFVWDDDYSKRQLDIVICFESNSKYNQETNTLIKSQKYTTMLGSWINAQAVLISDIKHLLVEFTPIIKTQINLTKPEKVKHTLTPNELNSIIEEYKAKRENYIDDDEEYLDEMAKFDEDYAELDDNFFDPNM